MAASDYPRSAGFVTTIGGAVMTENSTPRNGVNNALRQVAADLRNLDDELSALHNGLPLYKFLTPAQEADIAANVGAEDCSLALQTAITAAAGRPIILPVGTIRLNSQVAYVTSSTNTFTPGLKMIGHGPRYTIIQSYVANDHAIKVDTTASSKFQDDLKFIGFKVSGTSGNPTNGSCFYFKRAYKVLFEDMEVEYFQKNGVTIQTLINDVDSSNQFNFSRSYFQRCYGWAIDHDPVAGQNDLSFMTVRDCRFWYNGTDSRKAITGITQANPASVTCAGHGFTSGDRIRFGGVKGMTQINQKTGTITVVDANTFTVDINTTGFSAYASSGAAFPRLPTSGTIKINGQMISLQDSWITEAKNAAIYMAGNSAPSYNCKMENFSIENTTGYSFICSGVSGFTMDGCDLRSNQGTAVNYGHILLDATDRIVSGMTVRNTNFIHFEGSPSIIADVPHTAIDAVGTFGVNLSINSNHIHQMDPTNRIEYGEGLFAFPGLNLEDRSGAVIQRPSLVNKQTFTATGSYTPDIRFFKQHLLTCGAGMAAGTLTLNTPNAGVMSGGSRDGMRVQIMITNSSGGVVNLAYGFGVFGTAAPTTVASGGTVTLELTYASTIGWVNK